MKFLVSILITLCLAPSLASAQVLYASGTNTVRASDLMYLNVETGVSYTFLNLDFFRPFEDINGLAVDSANETIYFSTNEMFYSVSYDQEVNEIGQFSGDALGFSGLAFDSETETLFGIRNSIAADVYTINPNTAETDLVGFFNSSTQMMNVGALTYDNLTNSLYAANNIRDEIMRLDMDTISHTIIGEFPENEGSIGAFASHNGIGYLASGNNQDGIYMVDLQTGGYLGSLPTSYNIEGSGNQGGAGWAEGLNFIPEPTSFYAMAIFCFGLSTYRRPKS